MVIFFINYVSFFELCTKFVSWVLKMQWKNVDIIRSRHKKLTCLRQFKILSGNQLTWEDASQNQLVMDKTSKELTVDILELEGKYSV